MILVLVHAGNGEQAIRTLKRNMQRELVFRKMKSCRFHETPSMRRVREAQETERRKRKAIRKLNMEN